MTASPGLLGPLVRAIGDERATPDLEWVAALTGTDRGAVREVLGELAEFTELETELGATLRSGGRASYAQISAPFELYALTRLLRPHHIVEVGVSSGVSSTHFLLGLRANHSGMLHSIDLPTFQKRATLGARESPVSIPPGRTSGWAVPEALRAGWDLRIGPSEELLGPLIDELPEVDLFLHDDLHTPAHLTFELTTVRPKLTEGAVVLADNTDWTGPAFPRFAEEVGGSVHAKRGRDLVGLRFSRTGAGSPPTGPPEGRRRRPRPRGSR